MSDCVLAGLKLTGFAIWSAGAAPAAAKHSPRGSTRRTASARAFALSRPIVDATAQTALRDAILEANAEDRGGCSGSKCLSGRRVRVYLLGQRTIGTRSTVAYWELSLSRDRRCTRASKDLRSRPDHLRRRSGWLAPWAAVGRENALRDLSAPSGETPPAWRSSGLTYGKTLVFQHLLAPYRWRSCGLTNRASRVSSSGIFGCANAGRWPKRRYFPSRRRALRSGQRTDHTSAAPERREPRSCCTLRRVRAGPLSPAGGRHHGECIDA